MTCPECGLEMMIYQVVTGPDGTESVEYVCRNKRCGRYDRRMYKRYERALEGKALSEKDLTLFEYYEWLQAATRARDACLYGKLSQEEALRIIDVP